MYTIKIYKIVNDCDDEIYVGSTRNQLSKRMSDHRTKSKTRDTTVHVKMREHGVEHFRIVLIATYEVENCEQQRQREQDHIDELQPVLNRRRAHTTDEQRKEQAAATNKEYYENNRERVAAYQKEYYENNREQAAAYHKEYYENNREQKIAYQKERYENNREQVIARNKEYRRKTIEQKKYACDACGYSFVSQYQLTRHNQTQRHARNANPCNTAESHSARPD